MPWRQGGVVGAAEIIERHQQVELNQDRWYVVEHWLTLLPVEIIKQRPRLMLAQAWGLYQQFQMLEIPPLLDEVESLLVDETADETLLGEVNFYRGFMLTVFEGEADEALIQLEEARKRLPWSPAPVPVIAGEVEVLAAVASQMVGNEAQAIRYLDQKIHTMGSERDLVLARLIQAQVFVHLLSGHLSAAVRTAQRLTSVCKKTGIANSDTEIWCSYLRANADLNSYHLDAALQGFQYAVEKRDIVHRKAAIEAQVGLVLTYQAMRRSDDAVDAMKQLMEFTLDTDEPEHLVVAQSCQARLSLLQGDSKPAIGWARSFDVETHALSMLMWLEIPTITHLRIMVATGSHERLQQTSKLLATLLQSTEALHNTYQSIDLLALHSLVLENLERVDDAVEILQQAITLAEPGRWFRPFVELGEQMAGLLRRLGECKGFTDYLYLILDKFPVEAETPAIAIGSYSKTMLTNKAITTESLTDREFEILELLAEQLQNKEISTRLLVSPETVKGHLKNIYQKLDVHNRREAVRKAAGIAAVSRDADHTDSK
jgi:LuxR family maltose regulon positive regulatory protein